MIRILYGFILSVLLGVNISFAGTIVGKVQNGTAGYSVQKEVMVSLNRYHQGQQDESFNVTAPVDGNGNYIIKNIPEDSLSVYEPVVSYYRVKYYGETVQVTNESPEANSDVTIYEPTQNDSAISVGVHHLLIQPGEGLVSIKEVMVLVNSSDRTYVGENSLQSGKFRTILHQIPEGATDFQVGEGLMSCCIEMTDGGFYDTMELLPGKKEVAFYYRLNAPDEMLDISKSITLNTKMLDIIPMDGAIQISGENLKEQLINKTQLTHYVVSDLAPTETVFFNISGLSGKPVNLSRVFLIGFIGLLMISVIYALIRAQSNRSQSGTANVEKSDFTINDDSREKLLREIAILDEAFEAQQVEEKQYRRERKKLKSKLTTMDLKDITGK